MDLMNHFGNMLRLLIKTQKNNSCCFDKYYSKKMSKLLLKKIKT